VRTGDVIRNLTARVTAPRQLLTGKSVRTKHMSFPALPKRRKGELRIVGANIENYFADLGGYATKKTTPEQQALKTRKVVQALRKMDADIVAICEMQKGDKAPLMLLDALNKKGDKYAYVETGWTNEDRICGCFIYRKDRVRPYEKWLSAYQDTASHYYPRMITQGFEELSSGKRLIVSVNHLKSKSQRSHKYDTNAKRMENTAALLAMLPQAATLYDDPDILLLGDYNCYTQEQPIQTIVRAGYNDLLEAYCPNDYSYSYQSTVGYLDRCFASPTMTEQVIRVMPWHVNADWYYSHGAYKLKDKSLHRYSDHDPIIVDIKLK
jgi:predicted extracellular nuclease